MSDERSGVPPPHAIDRAAQREQGFEPGVGLLPGDDPRPETDPERVRAQT
jgi:hypothetical protein